MTEPGLYLYCIAEGTHPETYAQKGIGGAPVEVLLEQGFHAIVQSCKPNMGELVEGWILTHQDVVDWAWQHYTTMLPFSFGTVIIPSDGKTARQNLALWLEKEAHLLKAKLERLQNKAEYGVQVIWDPAVFILQLREQDPEIQNLTQELQSKPEGIVYLLKQKLEKMIRERLEVTADTYFKTFYQQIRACVTHICVGKIRKEPPPNQMILNVFCLQSRGETVGLGSELDKIKQISGMEVRFTGPWPPYSFVNISEE